MSSCALGAMISPRSAVWRSGGDLRPSGTFRRLHGLFLCAARWARDDSPEPEALLPAPRTPDRARHGHRPRPAHPAARRGPAGALSMPRTRDQPRHRRVFKSADVRQARSACTAGEAQVGYPVLSSPDRPFLAPPRPRIRNIREDQGAASMGRMTSVPGPARASVPARQATLADVDAITAAFTTAGTAALTSRRV
jgi:hypothetical protein